MNTKFGARTKEAIEISEKSRAIVRSFVKGDWDNQGIQG